MYNYVNKIRGDNEFMHKVQLHIPQESRGRGCTTTSCTYWRGTDSSTWCQETETAIANVERVRVVAKFGALNIFQITPTI